jgi:trehalose 6-phosphate synthase
MPVETEPTPIGRSEPPLLIASNRLPILLRRSAERGWHSEHASGGLVTALEPVLRQRGGTWVGWPGTVEGEVEGLAEVLARETVAEPYHLEPVELSEAERVEFYEGFSNELLWPLFHGFIRACRFESRFWETYRRVNRKFAGRILEVCRPGQLVWVHDYHLVAVGEELRREGCENRIGFFLHIPFPPADLFERLPWAHELLDALLAYDLVGFQTRRDLKNFLEVVRQLRPRECRIHGELLLSRARPERPTRVGVHPISIDNQLFREGARTETVRRRAGELRAGVGSARILLGVDRLDYTKGVPEKLCAYERLLERHPELQGEVTLVQLVIPSRVPIRSYALMRERIEAQVRRIEERFARGAWKPVHYRYGSWEQTELLAWYRAADVALVTSLKDGMNLVSKEFVAASVEGGVLVLSEFAGSADELREGALLVNPHDPDALAATIHRALTLDPAERRERLELMQSRILDHDLHHWVRGFLAHALLEVEVEQRPGLAAAWLASSASTPAPLADPVRLQLRPARSRPRSRPAGGRPVRERPLAPPT